MKKLILLLVIFFSVRAGAQQILAYNASDIIKRASSADTVYIINFWATWCMPCVQELPEFNDLTAHYKGKPVKVLLVSLDFKEDYPRKLASFVERKRMLPEVAWLSDTDPNIFIPKIEPDWQGSIPATLIIQPGKYRKFIEGQISAAQVSGLVDNLLSGK